MRDWAETNLGALFRFKAGTGFPKTLQGQKEGEFPFAKVSDMNSPGNELRLGSAENYITKNQASELRAYIHQPNSIAFAKIGVALTSNRRRVINRPIVLDNNMMSAEPIDGAIDPLFGYFLLSTIDFNDVAAGSALPYLTVGGLKGIDVRIPALEEQIQIAATLGALDAKIELNRKTAATLEEMARALYRSWFVDFDPVEAKAAGRAPAHMDAATAALFPDSFGPDGLPEGWKTSSVGSLCEQVKQTVKPMEAPDRDFHHFSLPAYDTGALPAFEKGSEIKSNKLFVPNDAILFSRLNPAIPRVWWARTDEALATPVASTEFYVARAKMSSATPWLYCLLSSAGFRENALARVTGTSNSHQRVPPTALTEIEVTEPSGEIIEAFGAMARPLFEKIHAMKAENQTLSALRDTLLPKLMSGELRVEEARELVEEVA